MSRAAARGAETSIGIASARQSDDDASAAAKTGGLIPPSNYPPMFQKSMGGFSLLMLS
jgi:hypothetical protein